MTGRLTRTQTCPRCGHVRPYGAGDPTTDLLTRRPWLAGLAGVGVRRAEALREMA